MSLPPIVLRLYADEQEEIQYILAFLQTWNYQRMRRLAKRGKLIPHPYRAGIVYRKENPLLGIEQFLTAEQVLEQRGGDCDDLAPYLAAYLNWQRKEARARVRPSNVGYHCDVETPAGVLDPSKVLGM